MNTVFVASSEARLNCASRLLLDQAEALIELGHQPVAVCQRGSEFEEQARLKGLKVAALDFSPLAWPRSIHQFAMACMEHRPSALAASSSKESLLLGSLMRLFVRLDPKLEEPRFVRLTSGPMEALDELLSHRLFDKLFAPSQAAVDQWFRWPALRFGQREVLPAVVKQIAGPGTQLATVKGSDRRLTDEAALQAWEQLKEQIAGRRLVVQIATGAWGPDPEFQATLAAELVKTHSDLTWLILGRPDSSVDWTSVRLRHGLSAEQLLVHADSSRYIELLETAQAVISPLANSASTQRLLEAMARGVPVAVSRLGAQQELIQRSDAGWICRPPHEEGALADWQATLETILERGPEVQTRMLASVRFVEAAHSPLASAEVLARSFTRTESDSGQALTVWSGLQARAH